MMPQWDWNVRKNGHTAYKGELTLNQKFRHQGILGTGAEHKVGPSPAESGSGAVA